MVMVPVSKLDFEKINELAEGAMIARNLDKVNEIKSARKRLLQSDSDGDDEPDDDSVTHDSMPELVRQSDSDGEDEPDDDSVTHESMPELARQSDDEREPNDDDNEDQVPQSLNVLPIHQQIGTVIQEMGYVPCGDLNEVDTTTEDDEEEDECEVQTEPKVQTEPIWIGHDE